MKPSEVVLMIIAALGTVATILMAAGLGYAAGAARPRSTTEPPPLRCPPLTEPAPEPEPLHAK